MCRAKGADKRKAYLLSLFAEEMTTNVVMHGFRPDRHNVIVLKLTFFEERIILSVLDNCTFFDPTVYYEHLREDADTIDGIGIRLVMGLSKNTVYTNSFNLNNVMIEA